jgi:methylisocitrate lyase
MMAERVGYRLCTSPAAASRRAPWACRTWGSATCTTYCEDVRRITYVTQAPLLVDADTGLGPSAFNIERTVRELMRAGAAGCHIEDQVQAKRCGHRPGKAIVSKAEMVDRVKAAVDASPGCRLRHHGPHRRAGGGRFAIRHRPRLRLRRGRADMIFPEAMTELAMYGSSSKR